MQWTEDFYAMLIYKEERNNVHPRDNTSSGNRTAVSGSSLGASLGFQATTKRTEADFTS